MHLFRELSETEYSLLTDDSGKLHLLARCKIVGECWLYQGALDQEGYPIHSHKGTMYRAHRFMYSIEHGQLGDETHLHHRCEKRNCVNPEHMTETNPSEHKWKYHRK